MAEHPRIEQMFPALTPAQVERVRRHGRLRPIVQGERLFEAGAADAAFFVVLQGRVDIVRPAIEGDTLIHTLEPGQFTGEVALLARRPQLLETTLPGVFAVGDVLAGNVKRVASAVGEGSVSIAFVHQALSE